MFPGNKPGESNAAQVRVPCIIFFVLTPILVVTRLWSRIARRSGLGWDDWTIFFAFACVLIVQILMMVSCEYGFGQHVFNLSKENKLMALKLFYVAQIFYKVAINLTKTSILLLYLRIFVQRWFRICCYILMGIILSYMVATVASSIWQCSPIEGAWDKSIKPTCISLTKNWFANAGFSIATDVLILMLPMQPLWASKLPAVQKKALMFVFALGGFVTITSIMRATTLKFSTKSPDSTYDIDSTLWTMIEQNVAIICACLPMCRMPLAWLFPSVFAGSKTAASHPYASGNSSRNQGQNWQPYSGSSKVEGYNHSVVHRADDTSEEYILDSIPSEERPQGKGGVFGTIRKTTKYNVSYDHGPERKV